LIGQLALLASFVLLITVRITSAAPPVLELPINCQVGADCYIQNFVDHDPGPGWRDYTCGSLSYDGHNGTDFAVADLVKMKAGVDVLAASAGTVTAIRDGEPDISVRQRGRNSLQGKDAGNFVRIDHGDGWETQYGHMKHGSITVHAGQKVEAGAVLGQVGLSGNTEFPHLDFTVRHLGRAVDPFAPEQQDCGISGKALWDPVLAKMLSYRPTGLLIAGFSPEPPTREQVNTGDYPATRLGLDSSSIVFWVVLFGLQKEDVLELRIHTPRGQILSSDRKTVESDTAMVFAFVGKQSTCEFWPPGTYTGRVFFCRGGHTVIDEGRSVAVQ
jgi:hypothetical protein